MLSAESTHPAAVPEPAAAPTIAALSTPPMPASVGNSPKTATKKSAKAADKKTQPATSEPVKPAAKSATVPVVKSSAKAPAKAVAKTGAAVAAQANTEKLLKPKKTKLVRDSFTIPKAEYAVLDELKQRATDLARPVKKTELLRAGIKALAAMADVSFLAAVKAVPNLKTGRPSKEK